MRALPTGGHAVSRPLFKAFGNYIVASTKKLKKVINSAYGRYNKIHIVILQSSRKGMYRNYVIFRMNVLLFVTKA